MGRLEYDHVILLEVEDRELSMTHAPKELLSVFQAHSLDVRFDIRRCALDSALPKLARDSPRAFPKAL
jgi:hypothetical protein